MFAVVGDLVCIPLTCMEMFVARKAFHIRMFALLGLLGFSAGTAVAAGFDCAHAKSGSEKLVCADAVLSTRDDQLNALYQAVLENSDANERPAITAGQKAWVAQVRDACEDRACLKEAYDSRLEDLSRIDDDTAYVFDPAEINKQIANLQGSLARYGSTMALDGCAAMIRIGTSAERSYGGFCRSNGRMIRVCDDTMVGKLTVGFQGAGSGRRNLIAFTKDNCAPGG